MTKLLAAVACLVVGYLAGAIGSRIDMTSRHTGKQLREMATGKVREHLFRREWLVDAAGGAVPAGADAE